MGPFFNKQKAKQTEYSNNKKSSKENVTKSSVKAWRTVVVGICLDSDSRNKSSQLWASPCNRGRVTLNVPKFKVLPAHPSQARPSCQEF